MFCDESIIEFYKLNFEIISGQHTSITLTELENMIPYEREIYTHMIINSISKRKQALEDG